MNPALVVVAWRRPDSLRRLLRSLAAADYPPDAAVPLVVSIDGGDPATGEVRAVADATEWPHGPKEVVVRERRLGLVDHFVACADLVERLGAIVLLEDDLVVSSRFHAWAAGVLAAYADEPRVALACLYGLWFNGYTGDPFVPLEDGADSFFARVPYTAGLAFTAAQWARLRPALVDPAPIAPHPDMHPAFLALGRDEWFPRAARALTADGRHAVFPRVSLAIHWGDAGTHFARPTRGLQAPLQRRRAAFTFHPLDDADAVYDGFQELDSAVLRRLAPDVVPPGVDVDLWATKRRANLHHDLVLTTRPAARPLATFGLLAWPIEANVIERVPGDDVALARVADVDWSRAGWRKARRRLDAYVARGRRRGRRLRLELALDAVADRLADRVPRFRRG